MTYLEIVNAVLRRIREPEVDDVTASDFGTLIGDFVNQTKREVEDAWDWTTLRQTISFPTVASQQGYTLTGAGNRFKILQAFNVERDVHLRQIGYTEMNHLSDVGETQESSPVYYNLRGSTGGDPDMNLWPIPDVIETLNFYCKVAQADLSANDDVLTVPEWPVILGAWAKALAERGEDGGTPANKADMHARVALSDAIALDSTNTLDELMWVVE